MSFSFSHLVSRSAWHHRRMHLALGCGVAAATAVIVGALLVGDSVRGSLRALTLERLGNIESLVTSDHFFGADVVTSLQSTSEFRSEFSRAVGAIIFPQITLEVHRDDQVTRATKVLIVGSEPDFWNLSNQETRPKFMPGENEIVLNEPLAKELSVSVGESVTVRLPSANQVPADSPLAHKSNRISSLAGLKVVDIIPARGLGSFSLQASQSVSRNAFTSSTTLAKAVRAEQKRNAILIAGRGTDDSAKASASIRLASLLKLELSDFGMRSQAVSGVYQSDAGERKTAFDYLSITTNRMLFSQANDASIRPIVEANGGIPITTYLANLIERVSETATSEETSNARTSVPYSMVTAIDFGYQFPLRDMQGNLIDPLSGSEIVLNQWTAEQLGTKIGDSIRISYFAPETTHGKTSENMSQFQLKAITPLREPVQSFRRRRSAVYEGGRFLANDPELTPTVDGITDQDSISNWDAPFPFDYSRIKPEDDSYWDRYRTTPKAFISFAAGQKLWGSRFGNVTSYRMPLSDRPLVDTSAMDRILAELNRSASRHGINVVPIRQVQIDAARGTTPFDVLFVSLSFFVIAAALLLVAMLFRLGVETRANELGILSAVGIRPHAIARLLMTEGSMIAVAGGCLGIVMGVIYAWLMLAGLRTWWIGAVSTPFLRFHWSFQSILVGWMIGVGIAGLTIILLARQLKSVSAKSLLVGRFAMATSSLLSQRGFRMAIAVLGLVACVLAIIAVFLGGIAQAGTFVTAGALLLSAGLLAIWMWLKLPFTLSNVASLEKFDLPWLSFCNARRHPGRSTVTIGLVATASFLIVALSSFRLSPSDSGAGGFNLIAESAEPVFADLNDPLARTEELGDKGTILADTLIIGCRLRSGDDASCNNLYQASQPRVIGVPDSFVQYYSGIRNNTEDSHSFSWSASAAITDAQKTNPWQVLYSTDQPGVPVVLDKNTAMYSLHLYRGIGEEFEVKYDGGPTVKFRVAGLLENSVLQGSLIVSEKEFSKMFPDSGGYRYFLMHASPDREAQIVQTLEDRYSDEGFDVRRSGEVLEQLLAVQNTYLSTFQSLGALGLLLGTIGLAAVQVRNVFERRHELAVMQATGFSPNRLTRLVVFENLFLLLSGLVCGIVAALFAVLPHKIFGDSSIPFSLLVDLCLMLAIVFAVGVSTSWLASLNVLRLPLLKSLRSE